MFNEVLSMGTAIVVTSGKGGVGKSTVSLGLASQFAAGGERVLLLDCDAGLRSLDRMTGTEERSCSTVRTLWQGAARLRMRFTRA